ncbi:MaoC family dehydratase [Nocardioides sp. L-11A]|uniref:MaoC family dehydratase n=1 Tax=Nocardioides sp. L-11A TaxID=3043848 RepID=UPI00249C9BE4|nr:MaoC family dehydratase [Nocardioides sp. L-11A]
MTVFASRAELLAGAGTELGTSAWTVIDQDRIDLFADATGDHQWIHVDPERAAAGPFGRTIAHGYLSLSYLAGLLDQLLGVPTASMGINYGLDKVRFPTPVPVDSRVRCHARLAEVVETGDGGIQVGLDLTVEVDGTDRPACVARMLARFYFAEDA